MKPKILLWDIETGFNIYGVFDGQVHGYISWKSILQERYIISASFKLLNEEGVWSHDLTEFSRFKDDPTDDYFLVEAIKREVEDADYLIHHNGDKFDLRFFNSRLLYHGIPPIPHDIVLVDTCKLAKKRFKLNSNSLEYIANFIGCKPKGHIGGNTWKKCFDGDESAVKRMVEYNQGDVETLEDVFNTLAPYDNTKLNRALFSDEMCCPHCSGLDYQKRGQRLTATRIYQRYQCNSCHKWFSGTKSIGSVEVK